MNEKVGLIMKNSSRLAINWHPMKLLESRIAIKLNKVISQICYICAFEAIMEKT